MGMFLSLGAKIEIYFEHEKSISKNVNIRDLKFS